jgi:cytochrome c oxidase subunit 3
MSTDSHHGDHAHHFLSAEHEHESGKLGVWLFIATEILMFGGLFVAYVLFRNLYPQAFVEGSHLLSVGMGFFNTLVLITSSFTMALAVHYIQENNQKRVMQNLGLTIFFASIFLVVKYFEYSHKIHDGMLPNGFYFYPGQDAHLPIFFGIYFVMTGLHGIHILVGMGLMAWLMYRTKRGDFDDKHYTAIEGVGLYWHIVDIIWIFLFPLYYLI